MLENQLQTHVEKIKNCIDEKGEPIAAPADLSCSMKASEQLAKRLLGCTLVVRGKKFIVRMLEIYYGGVGDDGHDWYRTRFVYKKSKYKDHTSVQEASGLRVYLSSLDTEDTYTRFDIVVGNESVPISFLVRSVWDENFNLIGNKNGSPNSVLKAMELKSGDHGTTIALDSSDASIRLVDTHNQIISERNLSIKSGKRKNLRSAFEQTHGIEWNVYID